MGEKDITEKILEDYNDVFADIINGLLFQGEQRVLPETLENISVHSQYKADDEKMQMIPCCMRRSVMWQNTGKKKKYSLQSVGLKIRVGLRKTCRFAL